MTRVEHCDRHPGRGLDHCPRQRTAAVAGWLLAAVLCTPGLADEPLPRVFSLVPQNLSAARARVRQGDATLMPALNGLRAEADRALKFKPVPVTDKTRVPPSGDKHDYLSQAPYWWPDPKTSNGLPSIRQDGRHNPEADQGTDAPGWARLAASVETLGLAYDFTGQERYAEQAARFVRVWFLDPATRMNPHLRYAQYIPGRTEGCGAGILEMRHLAGVCDALALMAGSPAWTEADAQAFHAWLAEYLAWLNESPNGRDEAAAPNNHGSWYEVQTAHLAFVLGRTGPARQRLTEGLNKRLATQTEPDGRGLWAALNNLAPYSDPAQPWPKADVLAADRADLLPLLAEALRHRDDPKWRAWLEKFSDTPRQRTARWHLLLAQ